MRCLSPILVRNKQGQLVSAPCGQCIHCRLNYARQWSIRIAHERLKYGSNCCFLTLTYSDQFLPADRSVHKSELQKFFKRLRKQLGVKKIRYFACGEYGGLFGRPHYHVCLFGVPVDSKIFRNRHVHYEKGKPCGWHADLDSWRDPDSHEYLGKVHVGSLTPESANYVAGYILKKVKGKYAAEYYANLGIEPEFVLMSRKPGIGEDYVVKHKDYYQVNRYVTIKGTKYPLPRYYVNKAGVKFSPLEAIQTKIDDYKKFHDDCISKGMTHSQMIQYADDLLVQMEKETRAKLKMKGNRHEN